MKNVAPIVVALLLTSFFTHAQTATLPAGAGTQADPYKIATLDNLYWIVAPGTVNGLTEGDRWTKYYIQTANIDASSTSTWESGAGWRPIGNTLSGGGNTRFTGSYHGQGFTISNLTMNRPTLGSAGFIGTASTNAVVSYVGLTNVSLLGYNQVGALIGYIEATTYANYCYATGTVSTAAGQNRCGGLVGMISTGATITNCYANCSVNTTQYGGGLIGECRTGNTITKSYAIGNVTSANGYGGGLMGYTQSPVSDCYARGNVSCTNTNLVGGLIGYSSGGAITNCYATGSVPATGSWRGGLTGYCSAATTTSYFDSETSGITTSHTGTPKTTAEMKTQATYSGWDFTNIWQMTADNNGYPAVYWQNYILLPVQFGSFTAKAVDQHVQLDWTVMQQASCENYQVQWSADGKQWSNFATIAATQRSATTQQYSYAHVNPAKGLNHYRIAQRDINGVITYSKIAIVNLQGNNMTTKIYPNPIVNNTLHLTIGQATLVEIMSNTGVCFWKKSLTAGDHTVQIPSLARGIYIVKTGYDRQVVVVN